MLVLLTKKCNEGCTHCMAEATPDGLHMDDETWEATKSFLKEVQPMMLLLSGGEPTLHPRLFEWVEEALMLVKGPVGVTSNGWFVDDPAMLERMIELNSRDRVVVQITSDPRFYPSSADRLERIREHFPVETAIRSVRPLGRARKNHPDTFDSAWKPSCVNTYLVSRQTHSLYSLVQSLHRAGKFCKPMVEPDGTIRPGEGHMCRSLGNVREGVVWPFVRLLATDPCNSCGSMKNLTASERRMVCQGRGEE
jgi:organic radical activating enzyme